ncbi:hypothetical protein HYDPIDRAFT_78250, partial [Hydnomerulius pinastri MD-312]
AFGSATPSTTSLGGGGGGAFSAFASQPSSFASAAASSNTPSAPSATGAPDFALAKSRTRAKPEADRYAPLLPNDYFDIIPADVKAAFMGDKFEWGKIPEWIPPKEVR